MLRSYAEEAGSVAPIWPTPDLTLIDNGRRPAVPMPSALFGPAWGIIEQVADSTSTAPDYAAMAYLASAASLIGAKRRVSPYGSDWDEPCILWCAALGDPSSRKSAPLAQMTKPLWRIQDGAREDHQEARRSWLADCERAKAEKAKWADEVKKGAGTQAETIPLPAFAVEPDEPQERRPVISDVTPEAAAAVLVGNPQGVLCFNDELAGWLEGFDRYTSGGRPFWLSAFGGRPHSVTRKGSGSIHVKFCGISVLGSIQPDRIADLLSGTNDGLVPRLLWATGDLFGVHARKCELLAEYDGCGGLVDHLGDHRALVLADGVAHWRYMGTLPQVYKRGWWPDLQPFWEIES